MECSMKSFSCLGALQNSDDSYIIIRNYTHFGTRNVLDRTPFVLIHKENDTDFIQKQKIHRKKVLLMGILCHHQNH